MSDARLRKLEKRFRDSNALEDEVMWLTHRLNEGEVSTEDLELAVLCGHEASRVVLAKPFEPITEFWALIKCLLDHPEGVANRAAIAAAEVGLAQFEEAKPFERRPRTLMREAAMKVLDPRRYLSFEVVFPVDQVIAITSNICPYYGLRSVRLAAASLLRGSERPKNDLPGHAMLCFSNAAYSASNEEVRTAVCQHLIPWVLGYYDPLVDLIARLQK